MPSYLASEWKLFCAAKAIPMQCKSRVNAGDLSALGMLIAAAVIFFLWLGFSNRGFPFEIEVHPV